MNLNDVQKKLAEKLEVSQTEARKIYDTVVEMITDEVRDSAEEDITIPGIVVYSKTAKAARTAKNPATGAPVEVPAHTRLSARPTNALKDMVR